MALNLEQYDIAGTRLTIVAIDKLDAIHLKQDPYLCRELRHFFSANYGFVRVQSLPGLAYRLPEEFYKLKYIEDHFYISDRDVIKYWGSQRVCGLQLPANQATLIHDLCAYLKIENLY